MQGLLHKRAHLFEVILELEHAAASGYILYARTALPDHKFALALGDKSRDTSSKNASISPGGNVTASTGQLLAHMQVKS